MKKTTLKLAAFLAAGLAFAGQAQANDPYIGIGAGFYNLGDGVNKKAVGGGYLQIGDNFAEHLGGEFRIGTTGRTGEEFTLQPRKKIDWYAAAFLKPTMQFDDQWMGYALLGIATVRGSYSKGGSPKRTKTRTGYAYGLGVQYRFNENYSVNVEFSHMLSKPKTANPATNFQGLEASSLGLSIQYHLY